MNSERYLRQTSLKSFGSQGQEKLAQARILVVGAGGLGVPVLQYLNAMGVGTLGIVENDIIELANLQRQVLYNENDIGRSKLTTAIDKLQSQNSATQFIAFDTYLNRENAEKIMNQFDLVIDATDNFPTRYLINDVCVLQKKAFIYGALHGFEGQVCVFNYNGGPTYRCLFPEMPSAEEIPDCNTNGVLGIIPGIIGSLQALEAVKIVTGIGDVLSGKLLIYDGLTQRSRQIRFPVIPENLELSSLGDSYRSSCSVKGISTQEFLKVLNSGKELQLIDVRTSAEYQKFHLQHFRNIPLQELEQRVDEIKMDGEIYLLCQSGIRSKKAVTILNNLNIHKAINIEGGINKLEKYAVRNQ